MTRVGLFDSGAGGLTVANALASTKAAFDVLADQAHVPYGGRPLSEVEGFALAQTRFLRARGAELVVMACNISSATALHHARHEHGHDRVYGMVEDGARAAVEIRQRGPIGVAATEGTVASGAYVRAVEELDDVDVIQCACPAFVPLVERGETEGGAAERAVREALAPLKAAGCSTLILGCTHYPLLASAIHATWPEVRLVDPALALATRLARRLRPSDAAHRAWTTGDPGWFGGQIERWSPWLGRPRVRTATWTEHGALQS